MKVIKFEKENCTPCKMVQNYLEDNQIAVEKINPFDKPDEAITYNIGSVPVTILLDNQNNEIQRSVGFKPDELEEIISKLK